MHRRQSVLIRARYGFAHRRIAHCGAAAIGAVVVCLSLSACSPGTEYPSLFPSVHDMPPPRAETPMDANQVQQATEALISERNHLSAGAQGAGPSKAPANNAGPATTGANPPAARYQPAAQSPTAPTGTGQAGAAAAGSAAADATPPAGAATKP